MDTAPRNSGTLRILDGHAEDNRIVGIRFEVTACVTGQTRGRISSAVAGRMGMA